MAMPSGRGRRVTWLRRSTAPSAVHMSHERLRLIRKMASTARRDAAGSAPLAILRSPGLAVEDAAPGAERNPGAMATSCAQRRIKGPELLLICPQASPPAAAIGVR